MTFIPKVAHNPTLEHQRVIAILGGKLLCLKGSSLNASHCSPSADTPQNPEDHTNLEHRLLIPFSLLHTNQVQLGDVHLLGSWMEQDCVVAEVRAIGETVGLEGLDPDDALFVDSPFELIPLRALLTEVPESLFQVLGMALQVGRWHKEHRYCGACGQQTKLVPDERARSCEVCQLHFYPRISPCVIGLVYKGRQCLLARHTKHISEIFTTLAGFIEPGETAEQAFIREVKEETNVTVDKLQYIQSQAWPFPGQLMLGFFAEYQEGDIAVDGVEISEAKWFDIDDLPLLPPPNTISRALIDLFCQSVDRL